MIAHVGDPELAGRDKEGDESDMNCQRDDSPDLSEQDGEQDQGMIACGWGDEEGGEPGMNCQGDISPDLSEHEAPAEEVAAFDSGTVESSSSSSLSSSSD